MSEVGVLLLLGRTSVSGRTSVWDEAVALCESGTHVRVVVLDDGVDEIVQNSVGLRRALAAGAEVAVEQGAAERRRVCRLPSEVETTDMDEVAAGILAKGWMTVWR